MEKWRRVWREGLAPQLSRDGLRALHEALDRDDPRLLQGIVSSPPPLEEMRPCAVHGGCAIGMCGWLGDGLNSVGELEDFFASVCESADDAFHEPAACRFFFDWYDEAPRTEMRRELLAEVSLALRARGSVVAA